VILSLVNNIIFLCVIGILFLLNVATTPFIFGNSFPQLHMTAQSQVIAVEGQVEEGKGEHDEEGETHSSEQEHHEESGANYSPLSPDKANTYSSTNQTTGTTANNLSAASLIKQGSPIIGNPNAPVTLIEFGDFQCEFCARFAKVTEPDINATYIQTGRANMVFKHFVTHGDDSVTAAIASQCANEQGQFWRFYKTVYENQGPENSGWASTENMKKFASQIQDLDKQKFDSCIDTQKYKSLVDSDMTLGVSLGMQGTPSFIILKNDGSKPELLLGAQPFPSFQSVIDKKSRVTE
jgi:protein-disulfide isomerase